MILAPKRTIMPGKTYRPKEVAAKLRPVAALMSQVRNAADAVRQIGIAEATSYRCLRLTCQNKM